MVVFVSFRLAESKPVFAKSLLYPTSCVIFPAKLGSLLIFLAKKMWDIPRDKPLKWKITIDPDIVEFTC
jgi:hypothetical protein